MKRLDHSLKGGIGGYSVDHFHINYRKASSQTLPGLLICKHSYLVTSDMQVFLCYGIWIKGMSMLLRKRMQVKKSTESSFSNIVQIRGVTTGHCNSYNYKTEQKFFEFNMRILIQGGKNFTQALMAHGMSQGI